ncbi:IQ motif, EF-hand binding site [Artemisia annua]|uniref:IQ motif, EF-hand binding site n=1 Tax=Artemisia annua TaxID=35608 RepID=A0A2U1K9Y9_ARTAN|nr:IQ motif, EF-hand binding site [Artemisia annua]
MDSKHQIPSSPLLLRDISNNFKTPKPNKPNPNNSFQFESPCPTFFSALKQTPKSSTCTTVRRNKARFSLAAQKVRAVELEQTKSSRKAQNDKEKALKSLAKSLTVWLNFLLENPSTYLVYIRVLDNGVVSSHTIKESNNQFDASWNLARYYLAA